MAKRQGNRPDRRIEARDAFSDSILQNIAARMRYEGSGHHKLRPGDYHFSPPTSPRPSKSVCDDLRTVLLAEASQLFRTGIAKGMISKPGPDGLPKYVWAVDADGQAYEAKQGGTRPGDYHGYRLRNDDPQCRIVLDEWKNR